MRHRLLRLRTAGGVAALGLLTGGFIALSIATTGAVIAAGRTWRGVRTTDQPPDALSTTLAAPIDELRARGLDIPVEGIATASLSDSFDAPRGRVRVHHAIDILAPRGTPVHAVEDGTIVKLGTGGAGGIAAYQYDPEHHYCFYYAHLQGYAEGLAQGQTVRRGQVIGYVGSTGNAPAQAPHLHFAIYRLADEKRWWSGTPLNPFQLWR